MPRPVVFLDRDGTINVDRGYVYRIEDWQFIPGAVEAIRHLRSAGYALAIVTNQSAIAARKYTLADVEQLHIHMQAELGRFGTTIDAIATCPHSPDDNCGCRKPRVGMAEQVERQLDHSIDYGGSWTIGDKPHDAEFGRTLGTQTILLRSRYWNASDVSLRGQPIASSLAEATQLIVRRARQ
jgi:D-glycero-D-manno-heptose 1,7-bisphosphate phosphatase